jgi:hypothetical protein
VIPAEELGRDAVAFVAQCLRINAQADERSAALRVKNRRPVVDR